jgi:methionyl-tRNA formyltransferase
MAAVLATGEVLLQERTPIGPDETYGELHDRLALRGAEMVVKAVDRYANGTLIRTAQTAIARDLGIGDDEIERTRTRPLKKDDLRLSFAMPPPHAVNCVRALSPQPLARLPLSFGELKVVSAHVATAQEVAGERYPPDNGPGALTYRIGDRFALVLHVRDGHVVLDRVVAPSRGAVDGPAFAQRSFDVEMHEGNAARTGGER